MKRIVFAALIMMIASLSVAQVMINAPSRMTFVQTDAEHDLTLNYKIAFYVCDSVNTLGACQGRWASSYDSLDVPKDKVTGDATLRTILFGTAANMIPLPSSLNPDAVYVAVLTVIGDATHPGISPISNYSNPFRLKAVVPVGRAPIAPNTVIIK